jgi:hypothetical protein
MKQRIHHRFPFLGVRAGFLTCMLCLSGFSLPAQVNVPGEDPYPDWVVQRIREAEGQAAVQQVLLDLAEAMVPQPARSEDSLTRFRLTADARPLSQPFPALWENWPRPGGSLEQRDTYLIRITGNILRAASMSSSRMRFR